MKSLTKYRSEYNSTDWFNRIQRPSWTSVIGRLLGVSTVGHELRPIDRFIFFYITNKTAVKRTVFQFFTGDLNDNIFYFLGGKFRFPFDLVEIVRLTFAVKVSAAQILCT